MFIFVFDFIMVCMNQLINMAAKSHYMFGGSVHIPLVIRGAIGRSWDKEVNIVRLFIRILCIFQV